MSSLLDSLVSLTEEQRASALADLSDEEACALLHDWQLWAREGQVEPAGEWTYWLVMAGRGYGKTRIGAEWTRKRALSGRFGLVNLIGATADDARDIMIEGESGILAVCAPWERPTYLVSKRRLEWPNGCRSLIFTADEPDRLRGKQHESLWADELAAWRYAEAWDQAMFGLRIGPDPRAVVTTTPRPRQIVRELLEHPGTVVTRGSTYDNRANLHPQFFDTIIRKYEGTTLGRQELDAELLDEIPGALWTRALLDELQVATLPALGRTVVGVDPNASADEHANDAGIIIAAVNADTKGHAVVLADRSCGGGPEKWARAVVNAYHDPALRPDRVVAEKNNGGEMVRMVIHALDPNVPVTLVNASKGKYARAEPVAALYEQRRVKHYRDPAGAGAKRPLADLEDEMVTFVKDADWSPDRMDAMVWALTDLLLEGSDLELSAWNDRKSSEPVIHRGGLTLRGRHHIDRDR